MKSFWVYIIFLFLFACQAEDKVKTLKFAHGLDQSHPVHKGLLHMKSSLEKASEGKMTIEIYANQQLGAERECFELLQIGSIDMTKVSAAVIENFIPEFKVLGIPYLFDSRKHMFSVLDGEIGQELLAIGEPLRLKGMGFYDAGSRSFYSTEAPISAPSSLDGKKIRTMESPMAMEMISTMGGAATPISYGELYTALQTNMVDGAENNPTSFFSSKHYEICKYYVLDEHTSIPDVLFIGTSSWNKLSDQEKQWLTTAVNESVEFQRNLWLSNDQEALEKLKENGVEVIEPDKSQFQEAVSSMTDKYMEDDRMGAIVKKIKLKKEN